MKRKKWELGEIRVCLVEPEVRPSFSASHLSCSSACWTIDVVQHVGREISNEFAIGVFERSPPTLILVPAFIPKEDNTNKDSTGFELPGSQNFY